MENIRCAIISSFFFGFSDIMLIFAEDSVSRDGRVLKSDVSMAKNYLQPEQIKRLERAVTG